MAPDNVSRVAEMMVVLWVLWGGIGTFLIACPKCGKSVFMRKVFAMPWPERTCSRCGNDLTAQAS